MMRWAPALLLATAILAGCLSGHSGDSQADSSSSPSHSPSKSSSRLSKAPLHPTNSTGNGTNANNQTQPAPNASFERVWADPDLATIRPGASVNGGECTANFIFTSLDNATVYIGTAAHCFSNDLNTQTDGCLANSDPLGAKRDIEGASKAAVLVYSSWLAMQAHNETGSLCQNNDLAILRLDPKDYDQVNPA